jgi:hypothetical protein
VTPLKLGKEIIVEVFRKRAIVSLGSSPAASLSSFACHAHLGVHGLDRRERAGS